MKSNLTSVHEATNILAISMQRFFFYALFSDVLAAELVFCQISNDVAYNLPLTMQPRKELEFAMYRLHLFPESNNLFSVGRESEKLSQPSVTGKKPRLRALSSLLSLPLPLPFPLPVFPLTTTSYSRRRCSPRRPPLPFANNSSRSFQIRIIGPASTPLPLPRHLTRPFGPRNPSLRVALGPKTFFSFDEHVGQAGSRSGLPQQGLFPVVDDRPLTKEDVFGPLGGPHLQIQKERVEQLLRSLDLNSPASVGKTSPSTIDFNVSPSTSSSFPTTPVESSPTTPRSSDSLFHQLCELGTSVDLNSGFSQNGPMSKAAQDPYWNDANGTVLRGSFSQNQTLEHVMYQRSSAFEAVAENRPPAFASTVSSDHRRAATTGWYQQPLMELPDWPHLSPPLDGRAFGPVPGEFEFPSTVIDRAKLGNGMGSSSSMHARQHQQTAPSEPINFLSLLHPSSTPPYALFVARIVRSSDQQASIFLQQKLKVADENERAKIVDAICTRGTEMMSHRFGNWAVQRCLEAASSIEERRKIASCMRGNVVELATNCYGCHVLQKALDCEEDIRLLIVSELLLGDPAKTLINKHASHVWSKIMEISWTPPAPPIFTYVNKALQGKWASLACHETGSLVVQHAFENLEESAKEGIVDELLNRGHTVFSDVTKNQWGSYCIQHILEHGSPKHRDLALSLLLSGLLEFSTNEQGFKSVTKALKEGGKDALDKFVNRMRESPAGGRRAIIVDLALSTTGSQLIASTLPNIDKDQRAILYEAIRGHIVTLRGCKTGSKVIWLLYVTLEIPQQSDDNLTFLLSQRQNACLLWLVNFFYYLLGFKLSTFARTPRDARSVLVFFRIVSHLHLLAARHAFLIPNVLRTNLHCMLIIIIIIIIISPVIDTETKKGPYVYRMLSHGHSKPFRLLVLVASTMAAVAVVAVTCPERPLPAILQPSQQRSVRRSRVVSFSDSSPSVRLGVSASPSPESSNPHTGESWFQISSVRAPPSPQLSQSTDSVSFHASANRSRALPRRSGAPSSWKIEWRGFSKVVKWVVLGEKPEVKMSKPHKHHTTSQTAQNGEDLDVSAFKTRALDKPLPHSPTEPNYAPNLCSSSPMIPLSPSTSATCVDLSDDGPLLHSRSELGHGVAVAHPRQQYPSKLHASSETIPQIDTGRKYRSSPVSRHGKHVWRASEYTNMACAASEQGHPWMPGSRFDTQNTFSDGDHSTTSHESTFYWPRPSRIAYSDIGHLGDFETMSPSAYPSALSLSNRYDSFLNDSDSRLRPFKSFRSAITLPVSIATPGLIARNHRHPRKLRKSLRAASTSQAPTSRLPSHYSAAPPASYGPPTSRSSFYAAALSAPLIPHNPSQRSSRKLTKKPSPALPPLPRASKFEVPDIPPPVPPKPPSILKNKLGTSALPSTCSENSNDGTTPPALIDTSASTSHDYEPSASPTVAASLDHTDDGRQSKRPSLLRTESNRRWTVAVADVPDDLFIEELERLRRMGLRAGDVHGVQDTRDHHMHPVRTLPGPIMSETRSEVPAHRHVNINHSEDSKLADWNTVIVQEVGVEDELEWLSARRTILCCRELVRTERSYQARLQDLADGSVSDIVPTLLLQYLPALIGASKNLSAQFNEDMSALGVSNALVNVELSLETAFVAWSGVVGEFFGFKRGSIPLKKRKRETVNPGITAEANRSLESSAVKVRCISMSGHDEPYIGNPLSETLQVSRTATMSSSMHWLFRPAFSQVTEGTINEKESFAGLRKSFRRREARIKEQMERRRKPPFRDLAILPTQRVTRYVLLYKGGDRLVCVFA
ncbi:hypothetical protein EW145_g4950 [Phellinidium pouzarii]|uniref:PUM-HD domain-containing protein n=1 Tax=Phellinidium pouzarii TaxID=167371 RepID=A0A4S4L3L1_9AGAM|nr:hypothetical protein EW145_g4950 [Phellinidium pouzarii]